MGRVIVPKTAEQWNAMRAQSAQERQWFARTLQYSRTADAYRIGLNSGATLIVPRDGIQGLRDLSQREAAHAALSDFGDAIRVESKDLAVSVAGILRDVTGLNEGQRRGGSVSSPKKAAAARANGRRGGRRKHPA